MSKEMIAQIPVEWWLGYLHNHDYWRQQHATPSSLHEQAYVSHTCLGYLQWDLATKHKGEHYTANQILDNVKKQSFKQKANYDSTNISSHIQPNNKI